MPHKLRNAILAVLVAVVLALKLFSPARATWYGESFRGKIMANGMPFNPNGFTAATWDYPLGAKLKIIYQSKAVIVLVTDRRRRGGFLRLGKSVDLTRAAFARLEEPSAGTIYVKIVRIN